MRVCPIQAAFSLKTTLLPRCIAHERRTPRHSRESGNPVRRLRGGVCVLDSHFRGNDAMETQDERPEAGSILWHMWSGLDLSFFPKKCGIVPRLEAVRPWHRVFSGRSTACLETRIRGTDEPDNSRPDPMCMHMCAQGSKWGQVWGSVWVYKAILGRMFGWPDHFESSLQGRFTTGVSRCSNRFLAAVALAKARCTTTPKMRARLSDPGRGFLEDLAPARIYCARA